MSSLFDAPQALPTFLSFENLALRIQTPSQVHSVLPADKMSATTAGLTNGGKTTYYNLSYINTLPAASGVNFAHSLIAVMDADFTQMSMWFNIQGKSSLTRHHSMFSSLPYHIPTILPSHCL
jgi:hypothetical protein